MPFPVANPLLFLPYDHDYVIPMHFDDDNNRSYLQQLIARFGSAFNQLERIDESFFSPSLKNEVVSNIGTLQNSLIEIVKAYLEGYPSLAYEMFDNTLRVFNLAYQLSSLQQIQIPKNHSFFRLRVERGNIDAAHIGRKGFLDYKQPLNLFHPPFQKRYTVSTSRFSISGYPCLYLSESPQISYAECFTGVTHTAFHLISFKNTRPLYFIDLCEDKFRSIAGLFAGIQTSPDIEDASGVLDYLGLYQLVIASHTKVDYADTSSAFYFKPEYIIPQLMLQWLRLNGIAIDGIRYKSCTSERQFSNLGCHYNYILPAKNSLDKGFCPTLSHLFTSTSVYSYLDKTLPTDLNSVLEQIASDLTISPYRPLI